MKAAAATSATVNANDIREYIAKLRYELQQYYDNESKGGAERRRNMVLLRWDIRKLERRLKELKANGSNTILNSHGINCIKTFRYMLLSRMQSDCIAYIDSGIKHLWAGNTTEQIKIMRALWYSLPVSPEWLTLEQIDRYAKAMGVAIKTVTNKKPSMLEGGQESETGKRE